MSADCYPYDRTDISSDPYLTVVVILGNVNCILKAEHKISIDIQKLHQRTTNVAWRSRALLWSICFLFYLHFQIHSVVLTGKKSISDSHFVLCIVSWAEYVTSSIGGWYPLFQVREDVELLHQGRRRFNAACRHVVAFRFCNVFLFKIDLSAQPVV